ncbi:hypothetical protein GCM10027341_48240 [Spirosoma knui]
MRLRNRQLDGRKFRRQFRRQFSVGNYVLDFYCVSEKLCVELDGAPHFTKEGILYDEERTAFLTNLGIRVLRFENKSVFKSIEGVLNTIERYFSADGVHERGQSRRKHNLGE